MYSTPSSAISKIEHYNNDENKNNYSIGYQDSDFGESLFSSRNPSANNMIQSKNIRRNNVGVKQKQEENEYRN